MTEILDNPVKCDIPPHREEVDDIEKLEEEGFFDDDKDGKKRKWTEVRIKKCKQWNNDLDFIESTSILFEVVKKSHIIIYPENNRPMYIYPKGKKYRFKDSGSQQKYRYGKIEVLFKKFNFLDAEGNPIKSERNIRREECEKFLKENNFPYSIIEGYRFEVDMGEDVIDIWTKSSTWKSKFCEFRSYDTIEGLFKSWRDEIFIKEIQAQEKEEEYQRNKGQAPDEEISFNIDGHPFKINGAKEEFRYETGYKNKIYKVNGGGRIVYVSFAGDTLILNYDKILSMVCLKGAREISGDKVILAKK